MNLESCCLDSFEERCDLFFEHITNHKINPSTTSKLVHQPKKGKNATRTRREKDIQMRETKRANPQWLIRHAPVGSNDPEGKRKERERGLSGSASSIWPCWIPPKSSIPRRTSAWKPWAEQTRPRTARFRRLRRKEPFPWGQSPCEGHDFGGPPSP